ncbi:MAG: DNA internalization-related competence protein ComEC/Rec2 [Nitrospirae bacterium]|nr:DNA internalization-related competence protein ComEC/Rec2 [Nitrospirota bacterium]
MTGLALSFICGIIAFKLKAFFPISVTALCLALLVLLILKGHKTRGRILLIAAFFLSGFFYSSLRIGDFSNMGLPEKEVSVMGDVINAPEITDEKARFTLNNVYIQGQQIPGSIRLYAEPELTEGLLPSYGDTIEGIARLNEPAAFHNMGLYSHDPKKDGITAAGRLKHFKIASRGKGALAALYKKREELGRIIEQSLSAENASFHKAIILGLQAGISHKMRDAFNATGLAHILSISGTHFALLAFILFSIIRLSVKLLPLRALSRLTIYVTPTEAAIILTFPVLVLYAVISGGSIPTIRSFIMVSIYMLAVLLGRKDDWLNSISVAALIILLYQTQALFNLSFQLSFIAVLSIGYALEGRKDRAKSTEPRAQTKGQNIFKKAADTIKTSLLMTTAATIGTAPIIVYFFYQFSLISPVANLIVTPLVCFLILPLGFFSVFSALIFHINPMPFSSLIDSLTGLSFYLVKIISMTPYASLNLHKPSVIIIIFYFLSLAFFVRSASWRRALPFILIVSIYILTPSLSNKDSLNITFLDVRQGDAAVVRLPDKKTMLIDGGSEIYDAGRRVIAPFLWSNGIKGIDYLVLTHPHPDHYGGLLYIMDSFKVSEVWLNGREVSGAEGFFKKVKDKEIPIRLLKRGDLLEGNGYKVYALHPYNEFYAGSQRGEFSNQNSDSLVLKIESGNASALFTGDIEAEAEGNLIHLGKWLKSDILKVPHHGGRTSSSEGFLRAVNPKLAIISAGKNNSFKHPHIEAVKRYEQLGIRLLRTDIDGALTLTFRDNSYEIKTYWDSTFKEALDWKDEVRNLRLLF